MQVPVCVVKECPHEEGIEEGKALGAEALREQLRQLRADPLLKPTYGQMSDEELGRLLEGRVETEPDVGSFPELAELHPEVIERLKGRAEGAGVPFFEACLHDYLNYRRNQIYWWQLYQNPPPEDAAPSCGCSGVILVGDEIWLGKNVDYLPEYCTPKVRDKVVVKRPRTGYAPLPVVSEGGIAVGGGASVGVWLDEPQEDVWPYAKFPVLRFAGSVREVADLYKRYTLYLPSQGANAFVDQHGNAISVDKSYRRVGISKARDGRIWFTEGYFQSKGMRRYLTARREAFLRRFDVSPGAYHNQYFADCAVRFTNMGRLAELPGDRRYGQIRTILGDHSAFPRALCRHAVPERAAYDRTITLVSRAIDYGRRTVYERYATAERYCCEQQDLVFEYVIQS